jgi:hypothetical protein
MGINEVDEAILFALDENPFPSMRQLSRRTTYLQRPSTIVSRNHSGSQRVIFAGVDLSRQLLWMLEVQHDRGWHDIVTLDESWFYLITDHEFISLLHGKKFLNASDTPFNRKVHADNSLESTRVLFDCRSCQGS